jgi:Skp family chaperone for outer membrane proteins
MKWLKLVSLLSFLFLMFSCEKTEKNTAEINPDSVLLAEVNGRKVYQQELEFSLNDIFGEYQTSRLDAQARRKALQSLVASHAMADIALTKLQANQLLKIEAKARRYRENLLINAYVKKNMVQQPITNAMIEDYYNSHLVKFGQQTMREYELLNTRDKLPSSIRDKFLSAFEKLRQFKPEKIQKQLKKQGFDVVYHKGISGENLLAPKVRNFIQAQKAQQLSNITFIEGRAYAVMPGEDIEQPAKALSEVRDNIRKSLAMMQVKNTIKILSESALKQAKVLYHAGDK